MTSKGLSSRLAAYKKVLASGEIQETHQELVGVVQRLRTKLAREMKEDYSVAKVMHGYLDVTYFYLQSDYFKRKELKLAIVLNHQHVHFELWLLGLTKDVQVRFWNALKNSKWINQEVMPTYSIAEIPLLAKPDFDDIDDLSHTVQRNFEHLLTDIVETLNALSLDSG